MTVSARPRRRRAPDPTGPTRPRSPAAVAGPLAATWLGHASVLLEVDGFRVLTDPMWSERASPAPTIGPRRLHPAPVPLSRLPHVDAVLISHDHYDHLDLATVRTLTETISAPFVVPVGIGARLRFWGVPGHRIIELDWGWTLTVDGLRLTCTRARHFSGRGLTRNATQWASWAVVGPTRRAFFGGDTGYTTAFVESAQPSVHRSVRSDGPAHRGVRRSVARRPHDTGGGRPRPRRPHRPRPSGRCTPSRALGDLQLGVHGWAEPVDRLIAAAPAAGITVRVPRPGGRIDVTALPAQRDWWSPGS